MMIDPKLTPVAYIIERVADYWGYQADDLKNIRNRGGNFIHQTPPLVACRHIAILLAWELVPGKSPAALAKAFKRDRSTLIANVEAARKLLDRSAEARLRYEDLLAELRPVVSPILDDGSIAFRRGSAQKKGAALVGRPEQPTLAMTVANE